MTDRFPSHWLSRSQLTLTPPGLGAASLCGRSGSESSGTPGAGLAPPRSPLPAQVRQSAPGPARYFNGAGRGGV